MAKVEEAMRLQGELLQDVTSRAQLMRSGEDEMIEISWRCSSS